MQIGRSLDLHERDEAVCCGQGDAIEDDQRETRDHRENAAHAFGDVAVEDVEADLIVLGKHERGSPQHAPHPAQNAELLGPSDGIVEDISEQDLDEKAGEHCRQQKRGNVLGPVAEPLRSSVEPRTHLDSIGRCFLRTLAGCTPTNGRFKPSAYFTALMRSSASFGQSAPYFSTYFFCAEVRKAIDGARSYRPLAAYRVLLGTVALIRLNWPHGR